MPLPDWERRTAYYGPSQFTYDAEHDVYICPARRTLLHRADGNYSEEKVVYRAEAAVCNACPVKADCTPSDQGRDVHRSFHAAYLDGCVATMRPRAIRACLRFFIRSSRAVAGASG